MNRTKIRKFFEKQDPVNLGTIKLRRLTAFYSNALIRKEVERP